MAKTYRFIISMTGDVFIEADNLADAVVEFEKTDPSHFHYDMPDKCHIGEVLDENGYPLNWKRALQRASKLAQTGL